MEANDIIWLAMAFAVLLLMVGLAKMCWPFVGYIMGYMS